MNIQDGLLIMQVAMTLVPTIFPLIKAVETAGNGVEKAKVVSDAVVASLKLLPPAVQFRIPVLQIAAFIDEVTSSIVNLYNITGLFTKGGDSTSLPPAPTPVPVITIAQKIEKIKAHIIKLEAKIAALPPDDVVNKAMFNAKLRELRAKLDLLEDDEM